MHDEADGTVRDDSLQQMIGQLWEVSCVNHKQNINWGHNVFQIFLLTASQIKIISQYYWTQLSSFSYSAGKNRSSWAVGRQTLYSSDKKDMFMIVELYVKSQPW